MQVAINQHFVMAGEILVSSNDVVMRTTLGSCIALVGYQPLKKAGGMCHYLLPEPATVSTEKSNLFYGIYALEALKVEFLNVSPLDQFKFWLVGGGSMMQDAEKASEAREGVAKKNIRLAKNWVSRNNIKLSGEYLGGSACRSISLQVSTGLFQVKMYSPQ